MTDLRQKFQPKDAESVAYYFSVSKEVIAAAIKRGAKTYADVYRFIKFGEI